MSLVRIDLERAYFIHHIRRGTSYQIAHPTKVKIGDHWEDGLCYFPVDGESLLPLFNARGEKTFFTRAFKDFNPESWRIIQ